MEPMPRVGGGLGRSDAADHLTGTDDGKSSHRHLVEVSISGDQSVRLRSCGESDEIVVLRVVRRHAQGIDWIVQQDPFVGEADRKAIGLLSRDVVLLGDPRMQQSLSDLVDELRADDQFELTVLPEIDQLGCCPGGGQCSRDEAIGIDDDADRQDFLLRRPCPLTS